MLLRLGVDVLERMNAHPTVLASSCRAEARPTGVVHWWGGTPPYERVDLLLDWLDHLAMELDDLHQVMAPLWAEDFRFVALDVETANREAASICQIGLGCARGDGSVLTWSSYVNPQMGFTPFNTELHGIGAATVAGAPVFSQLWAVLEPFLARHALVQHSRFDEKAIDAACLHHGLPRPGWYWVDSVKVARKAWPEFKGNGGHGLGHLKEALGLEFQHHDAGEDARASAQVVLAAQDRLGVGLADLVPPPKPVQLKLPF